MRRQRDHAARILVTHGDCRCDLCEHSAAILQTIDPDATVCPICEDLFYDAYGRRSGTCATCWRAAARVAINLCPGCRVPNTLLYKPRPDVVTCHLCAWVGSGILARAHGRLPPRLRLVVPDEVFPF